MTPAPATSSANDILTLCDHPSGTLAAATCISSTFGIDSTIKLLKVAVPTTDVDFAVNIDFASLGLSDTTFVASSGDGKWITFGEGNKPPVQLGDDGTARPILATGEGGALNESFVGTNVKYCKSIFF